jgi:hypothetical protein
MEFIKKFFLAQKIKIFYTLYLVLISLGLLLLFQTSRDVFYFFSYQDSVKAEIISFDIKEEAENSYRIYAEFSYSVNGEKYKSISAVDDNHFLNYFAAKRHLENFETMEFTAWFNNKDFSKAQIYKKFPLKRVVNFIIIVLVCCYFWLIKGYLKWKKVKIST